MIKIDGEKIKRIREKQKLTQLYIATVVEVTTDTISRWENKRYPTIKKENALKLAEALDVSIDDILLEEEGDNSAEIAPPTVDQETFTNKNQRRPILLLGLTLVLFATVSIGIFHFQREKSSIQAIRLMPATTIPDSPFPVVLKINNNGSSPVSLILKDFLPDGCTVLSTSPVDSSSHSQEEVKWLTKIKGSATFSYLIKIHGKQHENFSFSGDVSISTTSESIAVTGDKSITIGTSHWADSDGDHTISDQEILTVYDRYSDIKDFPVDIDLIEKMWLGSSYIWDSNTQLITVNP